MVLSLHFAVHVVLLPCGGLQSFVKVARMIISTSKSDTRFFKQRRVVCSLEVGRELLTQVKEF